MTDANKMHKLIQYTNNNSNVEQNKLLYFKTS